MTTAVESISDLQSWSDMVNNRREKRLDFRTTGSIYPHPDEGETPSFSHTKVWTVDVSTNGALVKSFQPIPKTVVLLELLMPELSGSMIEGELVRQETEVTRHLNGKEETAYLHGVHFKKFVPRTELPAYVLAAKEEKAPESSEEARESGFDWNIALDEDSREKAVTMLEIGFIFLIVAACAAGLAFLS